MSIVTPSDAGIQYCCKHVSPKCNKHRDTFRRMYSTGVNMCIRNAMSIVTPSDAGIQYWCKHVSPKCNEHLHTFRRRYSTAVNTCIRNAMSILTPSDADSQITGSNITLEQYYSIRGIMAAGPWDYSRGAEG